MSKSKNQPVEPKEFVWTLDIDGEEKVWKCLVTETECVTFEADVERKHLKIMNPVRKEKVLQIDTVTVVYGQQTPFQLENGIPYIKIDGHWKMSDTTHDDRIEEAVHIHQRRSKMEAIVGVAFFAVAVGKKLVTGEVGEWWMLNVFGVFCFTSAIMRMVRLRNELNALKEAAEEEAAEKAAAREKKPEQKEPEALDAPAPEEE
ncbi:MAG: hypothetical protein Q4D50_05635 [Eubacteriales bacterium]|nr:hypothetical protein [Eubacteriales bacterium]